MMLVTLTHIALNVIMLRILKATKQLKNIYVIITLIVLSVVAATQMQLNNIFVIIQRTLRRMCKGVNACVYTQTNNFPIENTIPIGK
jgi:hypothetical protein